MRKSISPISNSPPTLADTAITMIFGVDRPAPEEWVVFWTGWMTLPVVVADKEASAEEVKGVGGGVGANADIPPLVKFAATVGAEAAIELVKIENLPLDDVDVDDSKSEARELESVGNTVVLFPIEAVNDSDMVRVVGEGDDRRKRKEKEIRVLPGTPV